MPTSRICPEMGKFMTYFFASNSMGIFGISAEGTVVSFLTVQLLKCARAVSGKSHVSSNMSHYVGIR